MISLNNKVSVQQVVKMINKKTGEISYLIMNEDNNEWKKIDENQYNKIRGNINE